jgi:hypothetical protein
MKKRLADVERRTWFVAPGSPGVRARRGFDRERANGLAFWGWVRIAPAGRLQTGNRTKKANLRSNDVAPSTFDGATGMTH